MSSNSHHSQNSLRRTIFLKSKLTVILSAEISKPRDPISFFKDILPEIRNMILQELCNKAPLRYTPNVNVTAYNDITEDDYHKSKRLWSSGLAEAQGVLCFRAASEQAYEKLTPIYSANEASASEMLMNATCT
jgi:hypothetical protein